MPAPPLAIYLTPALVCITSNVLHFKSQRGIIFAFQKIFYFFRLLSLKPRQSLKWLQRYSSYSITVGNGLSTRHSINKLTLGNPTQPWHQRCNPVQP